MSFAHRLTTESLFFHKQTLWFIIAYVGIRLLSFALVSHPIIQGFVLFGIIMGYGMLYYKSPKYAWIALIAELLLGGAGHFLELFGLSLRSLLLLLFFSLWLVDVTAHGHIRDILTVKKKLYLFGIPFFILLGLSVLRGVMFGHNIAAIIRDIIPFSYLLLLLPAQRLFEDAETRELLIRVILASIIGTAVFSLCTYILFASELVVIHGDFYTWFRDVAMGKVTDMQTGFFRVVLPEHILSVPFTLLIASLLMRDEKHHLMWRILLGSTLLTLLLNFSRGYFLALAVGVIVLLYKHKPVVWLKESAAMTLVFFTMFFSIHTLSSNFTSIGLELFTNRVESVVDPQSELSANTRLALLDPIFTSIAEHPFFGSGLGATVTYIDPTTSVQKTTSQFDWGYLEMWVELGFFGLAAFLLIILLMLFELIKKTRLISDYHDIYVGFFASIIALLVMNITAPILFHVFGMAYIALVATYVIKDDAFDQTVTLLYRIFHKLPYYFER